MWQSRVGILAFIVLLVSAPSTVTAGDAEKWFDRQTSWHGFDQFHFKLSDRAAYIVAPKTPTAGNPWIWRARFPGYHAEMDIALLGKGFHVAYVDVGGMFGSPKAVAIGDKFYEYVTTKRGLASKPAMEGVSRGGLFVYNWAAKNPGKVACIYCDTPVCDFKSWPGGKGKGLGSAGAWKQCLTAYEMKEGEALEYEKNPVDNVAPIAKAQIPILHIVSENDRVVPPHENTYLLKQRFEKLGHKLAIISVAEGTAKSNGHHFDHPEPARVVDFIARHAASDSTAKVRSHPPVRPLPIASRRAMPEGPSYFVDSRSGNDAGSGSKNAPWKTIQHAVNQLKAGDVLCLRGGIYYENVVIAKSGTTAAPITIRGYPGELVVIDGGMHEFLDNPREAWVPVDGGAPAEFRSSKKYPQLERVIGNFGDSLIPLHSYRDAADLRATNEAPLPAASGDRKPFYVGPGLWYDVDSERIHVRLAHTHINAFGEDNYRGETDPRVLPLVVAPWKSTPLILQNAKNVRVQDIVVRGGGDNTVLLRGCERIEFDGVTIYAANRGMRVETTGHLRVVNCEFRGSMPPWGSRTASKYRAADSHLFVPVGTHKIERDQREYFSPQCHDFEIANCEFTDGHDGVYVGGVKRLKFHHNLLDNMNDDGVYLSAWGPPGSDVHIYENYLSRCLTIFAFGLGRGSESDPGSGTFIYRNIIDLRAPVPYGHPLPDAPELTSYGRLCGDHGGPIWEPLNFYHNTVITRGPPYRSYYAAGWGGHMRGTERRVFNNIFLQESGLPGLNFESPDCEIEAAGNLHWSVKDGSDFEGDFFAKFRSSPAFAASKKKFDVGWTSSDQFVDPTVKKFSIDWWQPLDIRLQSTSPAINAGVGIPKDWPDSQRHLDAGKPDIGAIPFGGKPLKFGPDNQHLF